MPDDKLRNLTIRTDDAEIVEGPGDKSSDETVDSHLGALLKLDDDQIEKIKKRLKREIKSWKDDTQQRHGQLEDDNNLLEGVLDEDDGFPFDDAYHYDTGISEMYHSIFKNFLKQSSGIPTGTFWIASIEPGHENLLDKQLSIEETMNYKAMNEWNTVEGFGDGIHIACAQGLCPLQITWRETYKKINDTILITSADEFLKEFPDAESAGVDDEAYDKLKAEAQTASEQVPLEVPVTFDKLTYKGNYYKAIDCVNWVTFPATAISISEEHCRGYGERYNLRRGMIKKNIKDGLWYEEAAENCLKKRGEVKTTSWDMSRDEIEGLRRQNDQKYEEPEFFELVYRMELDEDEGEREFLFTYCYDKNELVAARDYPYRVDMYALLRIDKRPNRMAGKSTIDKTRQTHLQVNESTSMMHTARLIECIPTFKAKFSAKDYLDPNSPEYKFHPGAVFWLKEMDDMMQNVVQPTDKGEWMASIHDALQLLDMKMGTSSALMSGQSQKGNKGAGKDKTNALLQQSFMRLEDPLDEIRQGIGEAGDISLSHLYQFGDPIISYMGQDQMGNQMPQTLHKKFLRNGIKMKMAATSVAHSPDAELQKEMSIHGACMQEPLYAQNPSLRVEGLRLAMKKGRVKNVDKRLPPPNVIHEMQVKIMMEAMKRMQAEQMAAQKGKQEGDLKARLSKVKEDLDIKRTSKSAATEGLQLPETAPPATVDNGAKAA